MDGGSWSSNAHGEQGQYPQGSVVTLFVRHHTCTVSKEM